MKKEKDLKKKPAKSGRPTTGTKEKAARPVQASSPNLGFHGKDEEKDLNPEE